MSISGDSTQLKLVTVGDVDLRSDRAIECDFIGRVIAGRYTVHAQLGGGGMADVFQATDEQLGVEVVIKLLKPRMASDELRARMVQEARAAAQVRHGHVVRVFATGMFEGTAYIVMELLDGPNLEHYLQEYRDQRLPWREALELLLPALEGLHAIHERGYVHRDIKPSNILVLREPGHPPQAVVIDLGLVKADRALRCASSPPTTEVGRLLCTPGYTSPEQAAGLPVDRRSDVYSMGVTLYRVLAGRLPFHDARGQPVEVVLAHHIYNEPTRLVRAAAGADIPPAVAAVIESALRKSPIERPRTMLDFAEALRDAAASVPLRTGRRPHALLLSLGLGVLVAWLARTLLIAPPGSPATIAATPDAVARPDDGAASDPPAPLAPADAHSSPAAPPLMESVSGPVPTPHEPARQPRPHDPEPVPGPVGAVPTPPDPTEPRARPGRDAAWHRALARRTPEVQRCADEAAGSDERLAVVVNIDATGHIFARLRGVPDNPLGRCIHDALQATPLAAPGERISLVHVFELRASPPRP